MESFTFETVWWALLNVANISAPPVQHMKTMDGFISAKEKRVTSSANVSPADIVWNVTAATAVCPKSIKKIEENSMREYFKNSESVLYSSLCQSWGLEIETPL